MRPRQAWLVSAPPSESPKLPPTIRSNIKNRGNSFLTHVDRIPEGVPPSLSSLPSLPLRLPSYAYAYAYASAFGGTSSSSDLVHSCFRKPPKPAILRPISNFINCIEG